MDDLGLVKRFLKNPILWIGIGIFGIIFLVILIGSSSSDSSIIIGSFLRTPFPDGTIYDITSRYGSRINPLDETKITFHNAVDVDAPDGTEIVASADGFIISYTVSETRGETVVMEHSFGGVMYRSIYAHMFEGSVVVVQGQHLRAKEKIGIIGTSGTQSTGVHLHFELQEYDADSNEFKYIDPINIFEK